MVEVDFLMEKGYLGMGRVGYYKGFWLYFLERRVIEYFEVLTVYY